MASRISVRSGSYCAFKSSNGTGTNVRSYHVRLAKSGARRLHVRSTVVSARQPAFEQHIQDDEHVAASHLLDAKFRDALRSTVPMRRDDGMRKTAHHGFQRKLHGQVEMARENRLHAVDDFAAVTLERVRPI